MAKVWFQKHKIAFLLTAVFAMIFATCFLFGCYFPFFSLEDKLTDYGRKTTRVIYTTHLDSYVTEDNVLDSGWLAGMGEVQDAIQPYYIVENGDNVDIVVDATNGLSWQTQYTYSITTDDNFSEGDWTLGVDFVSLDCTHIFSNIVPNVYDYPYYVICENAECICGGFYYEDNSAYYCNSNPNWSGQLYNKYSGKTKTSPTKLSEEELYVIDGEPVCKECWTWDESGNDEDGWTYTIRNICTCTAHGETDGPYTNESLALMTYNFQMSYRYSHFYTKQEINMIINPDFGFDFDELIIDGFDFSIWQEALKNADRSKYHNYEDLYHPEDFSYMFSDLPVEKITIKDVKGLDDAKNFSHMFENCVNLKTVDFGNMFEGVLPEDLSYMFFNCPSLQNLDLSSINTQNVTDMSNMFSAFNSYDEEMEYYFHRLFLPMLGKEDISLDDFCLQISSEMPEFDRNMAYSWIRFFMKSMFGWELDYFTAPLFPGQPANLEALQDYVIDAYVKNVPAFQGKDVSIDDVVKMINSNLEDGQPLITKEILFAVFNVETGFHIIPQTKEDKLLSMLNYSAYMSGLISEWVTFEDAVQILLDETQDSAGLQEVREFLGEKITADKLRAYMLTLMTSMGINDIKMTREEEVTVFANLSGESPTFYDYDEILETINQSEQNITSELLQATLPVNLDAMLLGLMSNSANENLLNAYLWGFEIYPMSIKAMAEVVLQMSGLTLDESVEVSDDKKPLYTIAYVLANAENLETSMNGDATERQLAFAINNMLGTISRDDLIEIVVNVVEMGDHWVTIDEALEKVSQMAEGTPVTKLDLICMMLAQLDHGESFVSEDATRVLVGNVFLSYDEFVYYRTEGTLGTIAEAVEYINQNPEFAESDYDVPQKEGGYTENDLKQLIFLKTAFGGDGGILRSERWLMVGDEYWIRTQNDVDAYEEKVRLWDARYLLDDAEAQARLSATSQESFTLKFGENFVVNSGTNVENMFGTVYNFGNIVAPEIADDVEIDLPFSYKGTDGKKVDKLTNGIAGQTMTFVAPEKSSKNDNDSKDKSLGVIIGICVGASVLLILAIVLVILILKKKKANKQ